MEDKAPKIPKFDLTASSDLLSRLGSFLPQLQAANELLAQEPNTGSLVDADLAIEGGGSDVEPEASGDDDSENENGESHGDEEVDMETKPQQQTIQLRLAVGNVEENPGISWLAAQDEDEEEEEEAPPHENDDEREREPVSQVESTISSLLGKGKEQKTQPKGPLITEME